MRQTTANTHAQTGHFIYAAHFVFRDSHTNQPLSTIKITSNARFIGSLSLLVTAFRVLEWKDNAFKCAGTKFHINNNSSAPKNHLD
jgi:hypothetical protein